MAVAVVAVVVVVVATATATAVAAMLTAMAAGAEHVVEVSAHPFDEVSVYAERSVALRILVWLCLPKFLRRPGPRLAQRREPPRPIPTVPPQVRDVRPSPGAQAWAGWAGYGSKQLLMWHVPGLLLLIEAGADLEDVGLFMFHHMDSDPDSYVMANRIVTHPLNTMVA